MVKRRWHEVLILVMALLPAVGVGPGVVEAADVPKADARKSGVPEAGAILKKVAETYKSMPTYQSHGTATTEMEINGQPMKDTAAFTMVLAKPDRYRITWTKSNSLVPMMEQSGAVWHGGAGRNLFMGIGPTNVCIKQKDDLMALASATGASGGVAMSIPSLFFQELKWEHNLASSLKGPKLDGTEKVNGVECYVISGSSSASKKETLWIAKDGHVVVKHCRSLEPPEGKLEMPEATDEQLEEALKRMGREVTDENKGQMREMMSRVRETMKGMKIKGTMTEVHTGIGSPKLKEEDFEYELPEGTEFKDSVLDMMPGGGFF